LLRRSLAFTTYLLGFIFVVAFIFAVAAALGFSPTLIESGGDGRCVGRGSRVIVLDPGHGGADNGANNRAGGVWLLEKELTLDISNRVRDILIATGEYKVCLTRTTGEPNPDNTERANYANSVGGSLMVLVHLNGASDRTINYTKTFYGRAEKDARFTQVMHDALWEVVRYEPEARGGRLIPGFGDGGIAQFESNAMIKSNMPATLVESVFVTSDNEANRLLDTSGSGRRQQIAGAIAAGVQNWFSVTQTPVATPRG
jgi:N-acetylmuramoyl-L-alanine amidase